MPGLHGLLVSVRFKSDGAAILVSYGSLDKDLQRTSNGTPLLRVSATLSLFMSSVDPLISYQPTTLFGVHRASHLPSDSVFSWTRYALHLALLSAIANVDC